MKKGFEKCEQLAKTLAESETFSSETYDKLCDFAYKKGICITTDFETYVAVEDEVFYFQFSA